MTRQCNTAAVLGSGVMGSAIAAHFAGAGIRTYLFDRKTAAPAAPNSLAQQGLEKALKAKPAAFYDADAAHLVVPGNFDDDLEKLRQCDVIVEAVVERLDVKQSLFTRIAPYIAPHALLTSNTSGLSLAQMAAALPEALRSRFLVLHFFNPVRYMHLLEIIPAPQTAPASLAQAASLGERLGKGVVYGKDTANFVANRIGVHAIMKAIALMQTHGLSIEEVDKIAGKPMGRPASAAFRTADLVGIDTFLHVAGNCYTALPQDEDRQVFEVPAWIKTLVQSGRTGAKSGAGFYKKVGKDILVLDTQSLDYRPQQKVRFESLGAVRSVEAAGERIKALVNHTDKAATFAWQAWASTMLYAAHRIPEIADDILNIDRAMRWGFNWDLGPFEAWDAIGVAAATARMEKDGLHVPAWVHNMLQSGRTHFYEGPAGARQFYDVASRRPRAEPADAQCLTLAMRKSTARHIVDSNLGASLVDLGDGCLGLEVHTKMNTIDDDVIGMLHKAVPEAEKNFQALVLGNDGEQFGAGANLMLIYMAAQQQAWDKIEQMLCSFQNAVQALRYAHVPVVAAPFHYTFGGAAELAMAADACVAHAETYMGLVEVGVGLVPAGGGCLRLVERFSAPVRGIEGVDLLPLLGAASLTIATAKVSTGAEEAQRLRYLLPSDGVVLNRTHLLHHAKLRALSLARGGYRAPRPRLLPAAGYDAASTIGARIWGMREGGYITAHQALIAQKVAYICCGGQVAAQTELSEQAYLDLEREAFLSLCGTAETQATMQKMLMRS